MVPERGDGLELIATTQVTLEVPVPVLAEVTVMNAALLVTVQPHEPVLAVTVTAPVFTPHSTDADGADNENVQGIEQADVVNVASAPLPGPPSLLATARK